MTTKEIIAARKQRWAEFYRRDSNVRRLFMITLANDDGPPRPLLWPQLARERIAWGIQDYQRQLDRLTWLDDDSVPFLDEITGTEIFAEALGCNVHRPTGFGNGASWENMPYALPRIKTAGEVENIQVPALAQSSLKVLFDIADAQRRAVGPDALLRLVDIQSPTDIAALVWDKTEFLVAMLECPESVRALSRKALDLLVSFCDEWFQRYGREGVAHFPTCFLPEGLSLSEDEAGVVSARTFEALYAPELAELSRRYGGLGMHCCAHSRHQWDNFRRIPGLKMLNISNPDLITESLSFFADHVPMVPQRDWLKLGEDPRQWFEGIQETAKLVVWVTANDRDQARRLAERLRPLCSP